MLSWTTTPQKAIKDYVHQKSQENQAYGKEVLSKLQLPMISHRDPAICAADCCWSSFCIPAPLCVDTEKPGSSLDKCSLLKSGRCGIWGHCCCVSSFELNCDTQGGPLNVKVRPNGRCITIDGI